MCIRDRPILLPDELSKILANLSVSPDTALRHIDALMGTEFTDMPVSYTHLWINMA